MQWLKRLFRRRRKQHRAEVSRIFRAMHPIHSGYVFDYSGVSAFPQVEESKRDLKAEYREWLENCKRVDEIYRRTRRPALRLAS